MPRPASSALFPYTTLFRSGLRCAGASDAGVRDGLALSRRQAKRFAGGEVRLICLAAGDGSDDGAHRQHVRRINRPRSEEHTSELQSLAYLVCRLLLEKKKE